MKCLLYLLQHSNSFPGKEYIFYQFFGEFVVDYSIASATGLFDIHQLQWCDESLEVCRHQHGTIIKTCFNNPYFYKVKRGIPAYN